MHIKTRLIPLLILGLLGLGACDSLTNNPAEPAALQASGVVEAVQVDVAPELPGRVAEVFAAEGDDIEAGEPLFRLDDELLSAQRLQAEAAHQTAIGNLGLASANFDAAVAARDAAELNVEAARLQFRQALDAARAQEQAAAAAAWAQAPPDEFDLPGWYFQKGERIEAARAEVQASAEALENERQNLEEVMQKASVEDLASAEARLAQAQAAFVVARELLNREIAQNGQEQIDGQVQDLYDSALAELDSAHLEYDQLLSDKDLADVLEARARLEVAQARHDLALSQLNALLTGEESLAVQAARLGVIQAENSIVLADSAVAQAEAGVRLAESAVAEAEAAMAALDVQISLLTVHASVPGTVLVRNVEPGEVVVPGVPAFTIGLLDDLTITVFIPEDRYGQIALGDAAAVSVDSFPGRSFEAVVTHIADQAEFTPRNVQTQEERITTVFAIELRVSDTGGDLKPGMPADVEFGP